MKKLASFLAFLMSISCLVACKGNDTETSSNSESSTIEQIDETFVEVLGGQDTVTMEPNGTHTYAINKNITGRDYIKLVVDSNVQLIGAIKYHDVNDSSKVVTEDFFIENPNGETEFKQFLDNFRTNGHGLFDKQLLSITLTNKGETEGKVTLKNVSVSGRKIDDYEREVYVSQGEIKVGADLATGGTLTYLSRTSYDGKTIDEVISHNDEVEIGVNAKATAKQTLSSSVNLINIFDAGRQFQQSYYANVGGISADSPAEIEKNNYGKNKLPPDYGANGYERAWCKTADTRGYYWPYNPVQGGDVNSNPSQIIDYKISKNEIYIKVRAMDWAKGDNGEGLHNTVMGGVTTKSYMENWYTIKGGLVYVRNRFIDWNGFEDLENVEPHSNELPAAYVVHPLHNYVCYTGSDTSWSGDLTTIPNLGPWNVKSHNNYNPVEEWFAWVNDEGFGVGVYVPNTDVFASGRSKESTSINLNINKDAKQSPLANEYRYNKAECTSDWQSCYTRNTSYTAPVVTWTMKSFVPMEYTYVISVDYVNVMRNQFKDICESQTVLNESLSAWK